jgi:Predicted transcriptional regulators
MLYHPATEDIDLASVLGVLGDSTRLAILGDLARRGNIPLKCSHFTNLASKSNLTYHLGKMREAGIIRVEPIGTAKMITIRRDDLDRRFPGFLDSVLLAAVTMAPPFNELAGTE